VPLIQDFCTKADLTLHSRMKDTSIKTANLSFDHDVIEAINNAVNLGFEMMGPHESNDIINLLSSKMTTTTNKSSTFLFDIKSYVDAYFWESNQNLCKQYSLNQTYFVPSRSFSKQEILDMIVHEAQKRSLHKSTIIENYRILSAMMIELCIKIANSN